jgi:hypothetical protein
VKQKVLATVRRNAHGIGEHAQRVCPGEILHAVEFEDRPVRTAEQGINELSRIRLPGFAELGYLLRAEDLGRNRTWGIVVRGGSASSSRFGGRHGFSVRKFASPTPAPDSKA